MENCLLTKHQMPVPEFWRHKNLLPVLISLSLKLLKADDISIMLKDENGELKIAASYGLEKVEIRTSTA